jgi:membrane fusion protein, multidrug efflux system
MNSTVSVNRETTVPAERETSVKWNLKRLGIAAAVILAALALLDYGIHWWTVGRFIESTDDAYVGGDVTVIAPKVAGFIAEINVHDNEAVRAGDLLVKLDDRDYRAALARAEGAVAGERASLANLDATRRLQESVVLEARAQISAADAETVRARDDAARFRELSSRSAASIQTYQKAQAEYDEALAGGEKARAALSAAERRLQVIDTERLKTQADLAVANADRDTAQLNLGYTELRAPIDGTVGNRSARLGALATVGAQLLSLVPAQGLWVDANFKESQLAGMHPNQPVRIKADVLPHESFQGHVASLAPATGAQFSVLPAENATGNFTKIVQRVPVRILLDGEASTLGHLRPGLSVTAYVNERAATERPQ